MILGVIGGTGLYNIDNLEVIEKKTSHTPFGETSAPLTLGTLNGHAIAFLPRHGVSHTILPSEINYRANIWALKSAGVRAILSVSAVGSLTEKVAPGDLAMPSQYFDWTRGFRKSTFFGDGLVAHISSANPSCPILGQYVSEAAAKLNIKLHTGLTYACVEGPRLGTRAESFFLRNAGAHIVGMTNVPEAFLALEAQMSYCTIGIATDYDCWLEDPSQHATVDKVLSMYGQNIGRVKAIVNELAGQPIDVSASPSRTSLTGAVLTPETAISAEKKVYLEALRR